MKSINVKIPFGLLRLPTLANPFCPLRVVSVRGALIFLIKKAPEASFSGGWPELCAVIFLIISWKFMRNLVYACVRMENHGYAWVILGKLGYACVRMGKLLIRMDNLREMMDMLACAWGILGNLDM